MADSVADNPQLKAVMPYVLRAQELEAHDLPMAYFCRMYAVQQALALKPMRPETRSFVVNQIGMLEKEKEQLRQTDLLMDDEEARMYVEGFSLKVFQKADNEDRAGNADKGTVRAFYVSSLFMDVMKQFGDQPAEIKQKSLYARLKATEIAKALREGRKPHPGPLVGDGDEEQMELGGDGEDGEARVGDVQPEAHRGGDMEEDDPGANDQPPSEGAELRSLGSEGDAADVMRSHDFVGPPGMPVLPGAEDLGEVDSRVVSPVCSSVRPVPEAKPAAADTGGKPPVSDSRSRSVALDAFLPGDEEMQAAQRYTRFASSALQFADYKAAIVNLRQALEALTAPPNRRG